ncbi:hypothetical protein BC829DRAFT_488352 [Chytridium lagenaria]|nr:hypothetical protein BC829DRAFT_428419 [Chytridium lagenaria]KAI8851036.1 hypothetical protein BC829DRAFT_488352 [Chytridium lagenaria]
MASVDQLVALVREQLLLPLVGEKCSFDLISNISVQTLQSPCFSLLVSKGLGLGIIVGGSIVKVPQLIKIVAASSAEGISLSSYILETLSLSLWLITFVLRILSPLTVNNVIISMLILYYGKKQLLMLLFLVLSQAAMYALLQPAIVPQATLVYLQWISIFSGSAAKLPQITSNFIKGSTGQLSAITMGLQSVGSAARVFTTMREITDQVLIMGSIIAASLNAVLFAQILIYGGKPVAKSSSSSSKTPKKKKKE